jgi:hypothetical protein
VEAFGETFVLRLVRSTVFIADRFKTTYVGDDGVVKVWEDPAAADTKRCYYGGYVEGYEGESLVSISTCSGALDGYFQVMCVGVGVCGCAWGGGVILRLENNGVSAESPPPSLLVCLQSSVHPVLNAGSLRSAVSANLHESVSYPTSLDTTYTPS